jgi:hypothetical protein
MKRPVVFLATFAALMSSVSLFAHHGTGVSYNLHKTIALQGVITRFALQNPHSQLYWDVTDEQGTVVHWAAEMGNPIVLYAHYSRKYLLEKLAPGTSVTVHGSPAKSGTPNVLFRDVVFADGSCLCDLNNGLPQE